MLMNLLEVMSSTKVALTYETSIILLQHWLKMSTFGAFIAVVQDMKDAKLPLPIGMLVDACRQANEVRSVLSFVNCDQAANCQHNVNCCHVARRRLHHDAVQGAIPDSSKVLVPRVKVRFSCAELHHMHGHRCRRSTRTADK
jgi:hypothetical protein